MDQGTKNIIDNCMTTNPHAPHATIGVLIGFDGNDQPLVAFPNNLQSTAILAACTVPLSRENAGGKVALIFVDGDIEQPMIIGLMKNSIQEQSSRSPAKIVVDDEHSFTLTAKHQITLQCGDASITLTKDGKILVRGNYISSRASGMQTIKGGSVQIN